MKAKRAKKGGETGKNGERYRGGQFLPNTSLPKRGFSKQGVAKKQLVEPGVLAVDPEGCTSLLSRLSGVYANANTDGVLIRRANLETTAEYFGIDPEKILSWISAYNEGGRWMSPEGLILTIDATPKNKE